MTDRQKTTIWREVLKQHGFSKEAIDAIYREARSEMTGKTEMTAISALVEHRTKIIAMKAALISGLSHRNAYSGWLDDDIKKCDRMIELAIKHGKRP
jgi:hypothetical protein